MYLFKKPNRKVTTVFLHCSASDNPAHDNLETMEAWHRARGFNEIGYHLFITKRGETLVGRSLERIPAAQKGHNTNSIAICLHGLRIDLFTKEQRAELIRVCKDIDKAYGGGLRFRGHREVANKTCPVFKYKEWLNLDSSGKMMHGVEKVVQLIANPPLPKKKPLTEPKPYKEVVKWNTTKPPEAPQVFSKPAKPQSSRGLFSWFFSLFLA